MKQQVFFSMMVCVGSLMSQKIEQTLLISNVHVIDVEQGIVLPAAKNVWIAQDRILLVDDFLEINPSAEDILVVDGSGKYLIPGLWDMHVHPDDPEMWRMNPDAEDRDRLLPLFVLYGVTGIRDMAGSLEVAKEWRRKIAEGELLGPKIYACGPLIDGPNPMWDGSVGIANLSRVKPVTDSLVASGADFLKVYSLLPDSTYFALSKLAREMNFPFVGHVPLSVTTTEASETGMKSQEHLLNLLIDCSTLADKIYSKSIDYGNMVNPLDQYIYRNNLMLKTYDAEKAQTIFKTFVDRDTWHTPTLSMWYKNAYFEKEVQRDSAYLTYLPAYMRKYWQPNVNDHLQNRQPELIALKQRLVNKYMEVIGDMKQAGVKLLAGTDMGANPLCFPGISLHNELELMVQSGLTPAEALRTATINPATFLEITEDYGTVEKGKIADLILLENNPLEYIENTRRIHAVIRNGRLLDKGDIERRLELIKIENSK